MTAMQARRADDRRAFDDAALRRDVHALLGSMLTRDDFRPVAVADVELTEGLRTLEPLRATAEGTHALVLVRVHSQPLGLALLNLEARDAEAAWTATVTAAVGEPLRAHVAHDSRALRRSAPTVDLWNGWVDDGPPCLAPRDAALIAARPATVVVATREHPELLERALESLVQLVYPDFEIIVVDNAPRTRATFDVVTRFGGATVPVHYLREDRPGLGVAHNRALPAARGDVIAFTDDDVVVDRYWLAELVAPFVDDERVAATTGLILPGELHTRAQVQLEAHGRYLKGFAPRRFDLAADRPDDPLFPFSAGVFGAGANMAFRADVLRRRHGFDPALGTGTRARGGDDLAAFFGVVMAKWVLAYQPAAIVWHRHRRDGVSVRRQVHDYAVGLGAYLTSAVVHHPTAVPALLRGLPRGVSLLRTRERHRQDDNWPVDLERTARRGLLLGPFAYMASRITR
jgi:glycosyltransferase involved in cell wall biosynthesis